MHKLHAMIMLEVERRQMYNTLSRYIPRNARESKKKIHTMLMVMQAARRKSAKFGDIFADVTQGINRTVADDVSVLMQR